MQKVSETNSELVTNPLSLHHQQLHPRLTSFIAFERTCGSLTSAFINIPYIFLPFHTFLCYLLLASHPFSKYALEPLTKIRSNAGIVRVMQVLVYTFDLVLIICLLVSDQRHKQKLWYSTLKRLVSAFSLLSKIILVLSSVLLVIDFAGTLPSFIISSVLTIFSSLFIDNFTHKKE